MVSLGLGSGRRSHASPVNLACSSALSLVDKPVTTREDSNRCAVIDGNRYAGLGQHFLKLQPAHSRQSDVEQQATGDIGPDRRLGTVRSIETLGCESRLIPED